VVKVGDEIPNGRAALLRSNDLIDGHSLSVISTPPTMPSPARGVTMADKSPNQHNAKKVGKSLKEKRNNKHAKKESKKGLVSE
jgi:hypothetical protein